jgi:alpha-tubulin suppressor-like RCC1 family protein
VSSNLRLHSPYFIIYSIQTVIICNASIRCEIMAFAVLFTGFMAILIAAKGSHTCAVMTGGGIMCWGSNANGQLGIGRFSIRYSSTPTSVKKGSGKIFEDSRINSCEKHTFQALIKSDVLKFQCCNP